MTFFVDVYLPTLGSFSLRFFRNDLQTLNSEQQDLDLYTALLYSDGLDVEGALRRGYGRVEPMLEFNDFDQNLGAPTVGNTLKIERSHPAHRILTKCDVTTAFLHCIPTLNCVLLKRLCQDMSSLKVLRPSVHTEAPGSICSCPSHG